MTAVAKQAPLVVELETKAGELVPAESKALAAAPMTAAGAIDIFAQLAREHVDVDKLDRLMQMHERLLARSAEEQFNAAMNAAQEQMRPIAADASNPQTKSKYASYAQLDRALRPVYTGHGFGISFDTGDCPIADHIRVLAYVTCAGHSRTYKVDMPNDGKGAKGGDVMTKTHATGAAMSYGMRYLLKMIFNVAVGEDDRDGNEVRQSRTAPVVAKPAGYDDWMLDMASTADTGWPALSDAWKKSQQVYRDFATHQDRDRWKALRAKAERVQA